MHVHSGLIAAGLRVSDAVSLMLANDAQLLRTHFVLKERGLLTQISANMQGALVNC